jgi:phenylacetate-coenzyme A ligase PaaK-like adenylate-forming protein
MTLIANIRAAQIRSKVSEREVAYSNGVSEVTRLEWQLGMLNASWESTVRHVPYWCDLVERGEVPRRFETLQHFASTVPSTTKRMVQTKIDQLVNPDIPTDRMLVTGGSTGEPTSVPAGASEVKDSTIDRWLGRKWWGIDSADRLFMIWGHSHLLGTGLKGFLNGRLRVMKDHLLGYHRFSAYQLDPEKLRMAADEMLRWKPRYVVGYSSALDYFARVNADRASDFAKLNIKGVFGSGESFPFADSAEVISRTFGCPAGMEYGSIETGVMGYSVPAGTGLGHFEMFWRSYIFELDEQGPAGGRMLKVTSLARRKWPLVRFELGDEVYGFEGDDPTSVSRLKSIIGKSLAFLRMDDGTVVHSVTFEHAVRSCKAVLRFQLVDGKSGRVMKLIAPGADQVAVTAQIRAVMEKIHPSMKSVSIEFTDRLIQTKAGKTPLVVFEEGYKPLGV